MKSPVRIVLTYVFTAALWIIVSDSVVAFLGIEASAIQPVKGLLFVGVTGIVLWIVLAREEHRRIAATADAETHRKMLAERENEYRVLFDSNPQPMWVCDSETQTILAVNQAAVDKYGYSRDEFISLHVPDVCASREGEAAAESAAPIGANEDRPAIRRHLTKSGELLLVEITSHAVHFEGHNADLVLARDVTARLEAERELREAKRQVEAIIETSPMAIILLDRDANVRLWNPAAQTIFGWSAEEVLGSFDPIVPEDRKDEFASTFDQVLQGRTASGMRLTRVNKRGEDVSVICFTALIENDAGEMEGALGMFADIGEQVSSELELKRYRERLEEIVQARTAELSVVNERLTVATKVKSEFLANMSHELRTPLNSIIGFSGAMLQGLAGELNEEQLKQMGMVYRSGKHLLELINDILDLSKIEAGRFTVEVQKFDVLEIVKSVIESLDMEISSDILKVHAVTPLSPVVATTDRTKVRQILINLIGNAVKFTETGLIEVVVDEAHGQLIVSVTDTGPGIPESECALIFDEFTQSQHRADGKPQGTGLGLAISRRLARILGGDIEVSSDPGHGSTFRLHIPATYDQVRDASSFLEDTER